MNSYVSNLSMSLAKHNELFGNTVLIVVPHSDDEVLIAGQLIAFRSLVGLDTHVCVVTNGDYLAIDARKGNARITESIQACAFLGLPSSHFHYLGYSDTGFSVKESFLARLRSSPSEEVLQGTLGTSSYGLDLHPPLHNHRAFTYTNLKNSLLECIQLTQCTSIITTSSKDTHGDHIALCDTLNEITKTSELSIPIYEGLVHSKDGDETWPNTEEEYFAKPYSLSDTLWDQRIITNYSDFIDTKLKKDALAHYATAFDNQEQWVVNYLYSFCKQEEIFLK